MEYTPPPRRLLYLNIEERIARPDLCYISLPPPLWLVGGEGGAPINGGPYGVLKWAHSAFSPTIDGELHPRPLAHTHTHTQYP